MSVLIEGVEMPRNQDVAICIFPDGTGKCMDMDSFEMSTIKAVPIQKHGNLIDAEALAEYVCQQSDWLSETAIHTFCGIIRKAPVIIRAKEHAE